MADDFGNGLLSSLRLPLDETGSGGIDGVIEVDDDVDWFQVVAPPVDSLLAVRLEADPAGALDTVLLLADRIGTVIDVNDDVAPGVLDSRLRFFARADEVYYILAQGNTVSNGPYHLTIEGPQPIVSDAPGPLSGTIEAVGDLDLYRFIAPADGVLEARLAGAPGGGLDGLLTFFEVDDQGSITPLPDGEDGARDGVVRFAAEAGRTYFFEVSAFGRASTGAYMLAIAPPDITPDPADAPLIPVSASSPTVVSSRIEDAGDVDAFRFEAPATGGVTIRQDAFLNSGLDSSLAVFAIDADGALVPLAANDDSRGTRDSLVRILVVEGQTYAIRASGFGTSTGPYSLTITPDDFGDDFASAHVLTLTATSPLVQPGTIDEGDVDFFRFVAPETGAITLRQDAAFGSELDSFAFAFDDTLRPIAFADDGPDATSPKDSFLEFDVREGETYFIRAGAFPNVSGRGRFGGYQLLLSLGPRAPGDDFGDSVVDAHPVPLEDGFARLFGGIDSPADVDVFRVVAPASGTILARQDPTEGSTLQAVLTVFDPSGHLIATDYDSSVLRGRTGSALQFHVVAGQTYFLQAAGFRGSFGGYDLVLSAGGPTTPATDDFGEAFATAPEIVLGAVGSGSQAGAVEVAGDVDAFRFTAPVTGVLRLRLDAAPGSRLDPFLFAFDDSGSPREEPLSQNDDVLEPVDRNSVLLLGTRDYPVVAGKTYFLKAAGFGPSTGRYLVSVAPLEDFNRPALVFDDTRDTLPAGPFDQDFRTIAAGTVPIGQPAAIETVGDVDVFRVVIQATGTLTARQFAAPGSGLDGLLEAYDGSALIARNNDDKGTRDSVVQFNVVKDQVVFLRAGAFGGLTATGPNVGAYTLSLVVTGPAPGDDAGDTFATALALPPGTQDFAGTIDVPGDVDVFRFVAPQAGTLAIALAGAPGGLDSFLAVFDAVTRDLVASGDDTPRSLDGVVQVAVQEGQALFVQAAGFGPSTGAYLLSFRPGVAAPPGDAFATARPVAINSKLLTATVFDAIAAAGDADVFRFVAPVTGPLLIRQERTARSALDGFVLVFDDQQRIIASNDDDGALPDAAVVVNVSQGQTFYVRATSSARRGRSDLQQGAYRLAVAPLADDFGDTFAEARAVEPLGIAAGTIDAPGDVDLFEFVAPATGRLTVLLRAAEGSRLDPVLVAFDDLRSEVARDDDVAPRVDLSSRVEFVVAEGRRYFLRASGYGTAVGSYRLAFDAIAAGEPGGDLPASVSADPAVPSREAGKAAFTQLRDSFSRAAPRIGPAPGAAQQAADAIADDLVRRFLDSLDGPPTINYLLLFLDPVDYRASDPQGRFYGFSADRGTITQPGAFYSGDGVLELLVIPGATFGRYSLDLIGVGPDPVLFGARLIVAGGEVRAPSVSFPERPGTVLPVDPALKGSLAAILDFPATISPSNRTSRADPPPPRPDPIVFLTPLPSIERELEPIELPTPAPPAAPLLPGSEPIGSAEPLPPGDSLASGPEPLASTDSTPPVNRPANSASGPSRAVSRPPGRTIAAGLTVALPAPIPEGGGLPPGVSTASAGRGALTGGLLLTAIPLQLITSAPTSPDGAETGASRGRDERPDAVQTTPIRDLDTLFHSLRATSGPLLKALRGAWEALRHALDSLLTPGESIETATEVEGATCDGSPSGLDSPAEFQDASAAAPACREEIPPAPAPPPVPVPVQASPVILQAPVYAPQGYYYFMPRPWGGCPRNSARTWSRRIRGCLFHRAAADTEADAGAPPFGEELAEVGQDRQGVEWGSVAFGVVATAFGLLRVHPPDGRGRRASSRRGGDRRTAQEGRRPGGWA